MSKGPRYDHNIRTTYLDNFEANARWTVDMIFLQLLTLFLSRFQLILYQNCVHLIDRNYKQHLGIFLFRTPQ